MDWSGFEIGGVSLLALVLGVVEFCKSAFGVKDRAAECLTVGLGGGLAIAGYYKLVKNAGIGFINRMVERAAQAGRSMPRPRQ